jgi:HlyD family secretion protein
LPKDKKKTGGTNEVEMNAATNLSLTGTNAAATTNVAKADKKAKDAAPKPVEVVFVMEKDHVKMVPVKIGISDDSHWEITDGLQEGQEVISGGYRAISRDLEDGKKVKKGAPIGGDLAKEDKKPE